MKLAAKILSENITDEIRHLVIASDEHDSKGCFLFLHKSLSEPSEADYWFQNLESAKKYAMDVFEVDLDQWYILSK